MRSVTDNQTVYEVSKVKDRKWEDAGTFMEYSDAQREVIRITNRYQVACIKTVTKMTVFHPE